jgi:hypothetical protein
VHTEDAPIVSHVEVVPFLHVLLASVSFTPAGRSLLDFSYLSAATNTFQLCQVSGDVSPIQGAIMLKWVSDIQTKAYKGRSRITQGNTSLTRNRPDATPRRRFLVVVNPHGGQGKAKQLWKETIEPIFAAAGCIVYVQCACMFRSAVLGLPHRTDTGPVSSPTNATAIARNVDLAAYDARSYLNLFRALRVF